MKVPVHQCYDTLDDRIECWYAQHGHDHPDYLPYWVRYMTEDLRLYYLNKEGKMFKDFTQDMLHKDFNWKQWEHYCHSMKAHDVNSPSKCLDCDWEGIREELEEVV